MKVEISRVSEAYRCNKQRWNREINTIDELQALCREFDCEELLITLRYNDDPLDEAWIQIVDGPLD